MLLLGVTFLLCTEVLAQKIGIGKCPNVEVKQDFDAAKYSGLWYEVKKYFVSFELGRRCVTTNFTLNLDESVQLVTRYITTLTRRRKRIKGIGTFSHSKTEGKLSVGIPKLPFQIPYWILDTDYDNYAVAYFCKDIKILHVMVVWILTRDSKPSSLVLDAALEVLKKQKLSTTHLVNSNQKNCTYQ